MLRRAACKCCTVANDDDGDHCLHKGVNASMVARRIGGINRSQRFAFHLDEMPRRWREGAECVQPRNAAEHDKLTLLTHLHGCTLSGSS